MLVKQGLIVVVGLALAAAMAVLGVWQLDVYRSQGSSAAGAKAAAPPLDLRQVAPASAPVGDGFGRSVRFEGRYDPDLQLLIPVEGAPGTYRVLSGLKQSDGSIVPVVRGVVSRAPAPPAPSGTLTQVGVLLPSEDDAPVNAARGNQLSAVRLPSLVQRWPGPIIGGFVTLSDSDARAQGIQPAPLRLPEGKGRMRNGAYALQWWLFGAFSVAMAIRIARDVGLRDRLAGTEEIDSEAGQEAT